MDAELVLELNLASRRYGFWPDAIPPIDFHLLQQQRSAKAREETYARLGERHRGYVEQIERTNRCGPIINALAAVQVPIFFDSRWKNRFKQCSDYVEAAKTVWIQSPGSWHYRRQWTAFFEKHAAEVRKVWMTDRELRFLRRLPKPFKLYRGYNKPSGKLGLSWSVDKKAAARIPFNPRLPGKQNPWVITAVANPEQVLAYLTERGEKEIVIHPKNILRILQEEPVPEFVPALERHQLQFSHGLCTHPPKTLTKKLLFSLPEGGFIVSEWFSSRRSAFAEKLGPSETRGRAWRRAVQAKAAGRQCQIVSTESEFSRAKHHAPTLAGLSTEAGP